MTSRAASNGTPKRAASRARKRGSQGKRRGPDPGITDELTARICVAIVVGASLEAAAAANGVPETTFFRWLQMGRAEDAIPVYRDFAQQIAEALGRSELEKVAMVEKAARKEWTAAAWILERRWPQRYGRRTRVDGQLQVQAIVATPEWAGLRDRMLEALRPFPEALDAVLEALSGPEEIDGEAVEDGARELAR